MELWDTPNYDQTIIQKHCLRYRPKSKEKSKKTSFPRIAKKYGKTACQWVQKKVTQLFFLSIFFFPKKDYLFSLDYLSSL